MLLMCHYVCEMLVYIRHQLINFSLMALQLCHLRHHYSLLLKYTALKTRHRCVLDHAPHRNIHQLPLWPVPHAILNLLVFLLQSGNKHFLKESAMINNGIQNLVTKRYSKLVLHKNQILFCSCFMRAAKVMDFINTRSFYNMFIP